jgi:hypothetical protein
VKPLAVHVRHPKRKKRPEVAQAPVLPSIAPARLRHAHPSLGLLVAVAPAASISLAAPVSDAPRTHSLAPFLVVLFAFGMVLLGVAVTPTWRIQRLHLAPLARTLSRHQLDLALGGGAVLFATLALYLVLAVTH